VPGRCLDGEDGRFRQETARRRALSLGDYQKTGAAVRVRLTTQQPVTTTLCRADGSQQRRVEDDERRAG